MIAKKGMADISSELGLTVRTIFVFAFVLLFAAVAVPMKAWEGLRKENLLWLGVSAATTAVSWIFYYKAIKDGEVSTVALIDKGSIIIAVILAAVILKETITPPHNLWCRIDARWFVSSCKTLKFLSSRNWCAGRVNISKSCTKASVF